MDFERHFGRKELEDLFGDGVRPPEDFLWGVANSGYQVEGGFNRPEQPLNNWAEWEREGKVESSGKAVEFWTKYKKDLALSEDIGLNGFRMGIEWARVQPIKVMMDSRPPEFDKEALEHYARLIADVLMAGMEPVITLQHFTHPHWAGLDFWTYNGAPGAFRDYVHRVVGDINHLLCDKFGLRPVQFWVTINEMSLLPLITYVLGVFPHHRRGLKSSAAALSNLISGHVVAYDAIHQLYEENEWGNPMVSYNTCCLSAYSLDKFITDLLLARSNGVAKKDLREYLEDSRRRYDALVLSVEQPRKVSKFNELAERFLHRVSARLVKPEKYSGAILHLYDSPRDDKLDYIGIDFYDPYLRNMLKLPTREDIKEGRINIHAECWDWVLNPKALNAFLKAAELNAGGKPIYILENGLCFKVHNGRVSARKDNATRDVFLQSYIFEALRALKDGVNLKGYFYWSLVDNYEWGSYDPRFGLYTVDYTGKEPIRRHVDAWGTDAGEAYRKIISSLKDGDVNTIYDAFLSSET